MLKLGPSLKVKSTVLPGTKLHDIPEHAVSWVLDGTGDFFRVADTDDFSFAQEANGNPDSPFSFCIWVKRDSTSGNNAIFAKAAADNFEYRIFFLGAHCYMDTYDTVSTAYSRRFKTNVATTNWQHLVFTHSGVLAGWTLYVNGVDQGVLSSGTGGAGGDMENLTGEFRIGAMDASSYDFDGKMCQAAVYNKELSATEVAYIYNSKDKAVDLNTNRLGYGAAGNLVAWYPLDDEGGWRDHAGSGGRHNLTLAGDAQVAEGDSPFV
jgi:hypothetical protein